MKNVITMFLAFTSLASFAQSNDPVLDQWHVYLKETGKFVNGGVYPEGMRDISRKTHHGKVGISAFGTVAPVIFGGLGNYTRFGFEHNGVIYLKTAEVSGKKILIAPLEYMAGKTENWKFSSFGDHACKGEEADMRGNVWKLHEYSHEALQDYAIRKTMDACLEAGGVPLDNKITNTSHHRLRKGLLKGLVPTRRQCLSSHVVLNCDFSSKTAEVKKVIEAFNANYPGNPSANLLKPYLDL